MPLLTKCKTVYALAIPYFKSENNIIVTPPFSNVPPGIKFVVDPMQSINEQLIARTENYLTSMTPAASAAKIKEVHQDFAEAFATNSESSFTLYLIELKKPETTDTSSWLPFIRLMAQLPQSRLRLSYLKALQFLSGAHQEIIKVIEDKELMPRDPTKH